MHLDALLRDSTIPLPKLVTIIASNDVLYNELLNRRRQAEALDPVAEGREQAERWQWQYGNDLDGPVKRRRTA